MTAVKRQFRQFMRLYSKRPARRLATLHGAVPGAPHMVYARFEEEGPLVPVYNFRTALNSNLPVMIGEEEGNPGVLQVMTARIWSGTVYPENPLVGMHGDSHGWQGSDPVYIAWEQILPLMVTRDPDDALSVRVYAGRMMTQDGAVAVAQQTLDLEGYKPAAGALYALIYLDDTGTASVLAGNTAASYTELNYEDIPARPMNTAALAAVRLFAGQTEISMLYADADIVDLRYAPQFNNSGFVAMQISALEHFLDAEITMVALRTQQVSEAAFRLDYFQDVEMTKHRVTGG